MAAALLVGCEKESVQSYSISSESYSPISPGAPMVSWVIPDGWRERPSGGSSMRYATFEIDGPHGHNVDVSITPLPGASGGELDNVNRWRGQVGLKPTTEEELDKQAEEILIGETKGRLFDMTSEDATVHGEHHQRILAATLSKPGKVWFFKMMGVAETVGEQKDAFVGFLKSLSIKEPEIPASHPSMASMMNPHSGSGMPPGMGSGMNVGAPRSSGADKPDWQVPEGWKEAQGSPMRIGTFSVAGEGTQAAEVAITKFPGMVGTMLDNINRWRGQVGLSPVAADAIDRYSRKLDWEGLEATLVDTSGVKEDGRDAADMRLITVIVNKDGFKWFYKLTGDNDLVGAQEENLIKFARSAH